MLPPPPEPPHNITGLVLAGGRARRWGGADKGLARVAGRRMIDFVIDRLAPQVEQLLISANRNPDAYAALGRQVIADDGPGKPAFDGPLAGIAAGLAAARTDWVAVVPCDAPLLPGDLVARLAAGLRGTRVAMAHDGRRAQPLFSLLTRDRRDTILDWLRAGRRSATDWFEKQQPALVDFSDCPENFTNLNRPEDVQRIQRLLAVGFPVPPNSD